MNIDSNEKDNFIKYETKLYFAEGIKKMQVGLVYAIILMPNCLKKSL
jgi:hypothetical protein